MGSFSVEYCTPKDEESLSDFVFLQLKQLRDRAIILNREVQLRRKHGDSPGEVVDIHIDAVPVETTETETPSLKVVIEVKGCWNKHLKTDMSTQLAKRYLAGGSHEAGLYLVGWFLCDQWGKNDHRRRKTPKWTARKAREYFQRQAAELSRSGRSIRAVVLDAALK